MAKRRFQTLTDIRRYLGSLLNRIESGEIEEAPASKRAYIANILASCVKDSDLEARIERLEQQIQSKNKGGNIYEFKKPN